MHSSRRLELLAQSAMSPGAAGPAVHGSLGPGDCCAADSPRAAVRVAAQRAAAAAPPSPASGGAAKDPTCPWRLGRRMLSRCDYPQAALRPRISAVNLYRCEESCWHLPHGDHP